MGLRALVGSSMMISSAPEVRARAISVSWCTPSG